MKHEAFDTALLPIDPESGEPVLPRPQPGYYPGFSTLSQELFWDDATRKVVTARVEIRPPIHFFTRDQADFWSIVFDHLIPQTDRILERRIPILPALDKRLFLNRTSGYRFANMPHDREVYLLGIDAINEESQEQYGSGFIPRTARNSQRFS